MPWPSASRGLRSLARLAVEADVALVVPVGPGEEADQLGASGPEETGEAEHLPAVDLQVVRLDGALAARPPRR